MCEMCKTLFQEDEAGRRQKPLRSQPKKKRGVISKIYLAGLIGMVLGTVSVCSMALGPFVPTLRILVIGVVWWTIACWIVPVLSRIFNRFAETLW